mgnify:CR=1 FL=1
MNTETIDQSNENELAEQRFKRALLGLLKKAIIKDPETRAQAIAEAIAVSERSRSSVHNWLGTGDNVPDIAAFFKLVIHYNIDLRGPEMLAALKHLNPDYNQPFSGSPMDGCMRLVPLSAAASVNQTLQRYTHSPTYTVLMPYRSDDMAPDIARGELVLVDVSIEKINGGGIYLIQVGDNICLRAAAPDVSTGNIRLSAVNLLADVRHQSVKPNDDGTLPGIAIHGRLVGVLKESVIHFNRPLAS